MKIDELINSEYKRLQNKTYIDIKRCPTEKTCINEYIKLIKTGQSVLPSSSSSSSLIRRFHPSRYFANKKNMLSPYDGFNIIKNDINKFKKLFNNRLQYSRFINRNDISNFIELPDFIYAEGIQAIRKYPEVSYFKPILAKYLINKYLSKYDIIFDPFSGYSGRMLGTISLNKTYIGQDISNIVIEESLQLYDFIINNFNNVSTVYLESENSITTTGEFQALFTCPPYNDKEQWVDVNLENKNLENKSCDEWIDICLENYKCKKYLFVVDDKIEKWKSNIVETLENKSHFGKNIEYVVLI